jgi:hypothetical protein
MMPPYPVNPDWGLFLGNMTMPESPREGRRLYAPLKHIATQISGHSGSVVIDAVKS